MDWIPYAIITLSLFALWRTLHHQYVHQRFRHRMYALRDQLRRLAIDGKINPDEWTFDYFDTSFSTAVSKSYHLTFFYLVGLAVLHRDDQQLHAFNQKLEGEIQDAPELLTLRVAHQKAVSDYIQAQHLVGGILISPLLLIPALAIQIRKLIISWNQQVFVYPETSASGRFGY